jgi:hypothetical protein
MIKRASLNQKFSGNFVKVADPKAEKALSYLDDIKGFFTSPEMAARAQAFKDFGLNYGDDIGIGAGAAGIAGLGGAAALRNIKALQRTNPGAFARLMGAKPTGLTRGQLNMLGGGLGLGAGVGAGMKADLIEQLAASGYGKAKALGTAGADEARALYKRLLGGADVGVDPNSVMTHHDIGLNPLNN